MIANPGYRLPAFVVGWLLVSAGTAAAQGSTVCSFTAGPRAGSSVDYAATWAPLRVGTPCLDGMGSTGYVGAGNPRRTVGMSTVCHFTAGPRAGTSVDYAATWAPLAVGTPCLDGMGSTGYVGGGNPRRTVGMSTVCHFTAGPRRGTSFDYSATWSPLAVGTPCLDGMGSTGTVR